MYTEKKDPIHSIKWKLWIFRNWINWIFIYGNENNYLYPAIRCAETQYKFLLISNKNLFDRRFEETVYSIQINNVFKITAPIKHSFGGILFADGWEMARQSYPVENPVENRWR